MAVVLLVVGGGGMAGGGDRGPHDCRGAQPRAKNA